MRGVTGSPRRLTLDDVDQPEDHEHDHDHADDPDAAASVHLDLRFSVPSRAIIYGAGT
jgi:hypothetical protein